jgi:hypothetical protein
VKVDAAKFANVARYLAHINSFSAAAQAKCVTLCHVFAFRDRCRFASACVFCYF